MIKAVIVDDEPGNVMILDNLIKDFCPNVMVLGKAGNAAKADTLIREVHPDLVFLDIEMPYGNAFGILDKFRPLNFEVIFVTAFKEYVLKAFRYSALDYLLKPINIGELQEAVQKAGEALRLKNLDRKLDSFLESFERPALDMPRIALPGKNGVVFVPVMDIIRCEGSRGYTCLYVKNKGKIISSRNIKEYETMLPEGKFYRVHNSHLVNLSCVSGYQRGRGGYVEMEDGVKIEVAVRRKDELMIRLGLI